MSDAFWPYTRLMERRKHWSRTMNSKRSNAYYYWSAKAHIPGIFVRKPLNALMSIRKPGKMTNLRLHIDHLHHKLNK